MTSPAPSALDTAVDTVDKREDENSRNEQTSSQPEPQAFDPLHFEGYLFPPPPRPTPRQRSKPSARPRRRQLISWSTRNSRDSIPHLPPAEGQSLDDQPLPANNLDTVTTHPNSSLTGDETELLERLRAPRGSQKRSKSEFRDAEDEIDYSDEDTRYSRVERNGTEILDLDFGENTRLCDDPGFDHLDSPDSGFLVGTEARPTNWNWYQSEQEGGVEDWSVTGVQEFGIAQSREDDFNATWFRTDQVREDRRKRDVPGGLIRLAQTSTKTEWRQDEDSSVGATQYQVDAAYHASMRQALSCIKTDSTTSPSIGESQRIKDGDSVTKSLKEVDMVEKSTSQWMERSETPVRKRARIRKAPGAVVNFTGEE